MKLQTAQIRHDVRERMLSGIEDEALVVLKFSSADLDKLSWHRDDEFEFQGEMYDVVERRMDGDTFVLACWPDHAESRLHRQMEELIASATQDDPLRRTVLQHVFDFLKTICPGHVITPYINVLWYQMNGVSSNFIPHMLPMVAPPEPPPDIT
jgi:hypothetical protein